MRYTIICVFFLFYLASTHCLNFYEVTTKMATHPKDFHQKRVNAIEGYSEKIKFPKTNKQENNKIQRAEYSISEQTNMRNSYANTKMLSDTISNISDSGSLMLRNLERVINKQIKSETTETSILRDVLDNYYDSLEEYSNYFYKQMVKCDLEREFHMLDFIVTANKILTNHSKELLKKMMATSNENDARVNNNHTIQLSAHIHQAVMNEKKFTFTILCDRLNICRQFPAYSDRISDIVNEIVALPDTKFRTFIKLLNNIIVMRAENLKKLTNVDITNRDNMTSKFSYLEGNLTEAQEGFLYLKRIIDKRHQIFKSKNGEIKIRKKALRILIDLFDKPFETLAEDFIQTNVNNVIFGLRAWSKKDSTDIIKILNVFIDDLEKNLYPFLLHPAVGIQFKTLVDIILLRSSKYSDVYMNNNDLFTKGSKYVNTGKFNFQTHSELPDVFATQKFSLRLKK